MLLAALLLALPAPRPALAADGAGAEDLADSLEDALLEDLGDDFLKKPDAEKPTEQKPAGKNEPAEKKIVGEDIGQGPEEQDPLARIGRQMRMVEKLLARREELKRAPELQQQIVQDLEELIERIKRQKSQQQSQGSKSGKPGGQRSKVQQPGKQPGQAPGNQPARDSTDRLGQEAAKRVDMAHMQDLMKDVWGQLPDRAREQMLQSSVDQFLPEYEVLIEKYFRRLAEDQQREEGQLEISH
jgi:hypothetical protein